MNSLREIKKQGKNLDCRVFKPGILNIMKLILTQNKINCVNKRLKNLISNASSKNDIEDHDSLPKLVISHKKHTKDLNRLNSLISKQTIKKLYIEIDDMDIKITEIVPKCHKCNSDSDSDTNTSSDSDTNTSSKSD